MCSPDAFRIDHEYDRANASDDVSRYGAYVRNSVSEFTECWDGTWDDPKSLRVDFTAAAWRVATGPVMTPGYVQFHPRILDAWLNRNGWDGSLTATITLATPWPRPLASSHAWLADTRWQDWPVLRAFGADHVTYNEPTEQELARSAYLMASARLAFPIPDSGLPTPPSGPRDDLEATARTAVSHVADVLNRIVTPVVKAIN
jgi:hypothetical protein